ncbi:MAG: Ppx/GppA family phosphatase [Planctomycetes bacterium]|nr:Ppx/GppA family phosphatase [Planctomycetota bacterium]
MPMEDKQFFLSPELAHRLAAIDIGTNSIRLIIAEALRHGKYRILDDEKASTRLGRNLGQTGQLDPEAVEQSLEALRRMKQIADGYQVTSLRTIATCAVREAADGAEFCRRAKEEIGLDVEVISAKKEARLAFAGVQRNFELDGKNVAVADIGGGSTEIVMASGPVIAEIYTTPLGAVRLTETYLHDSTPAEGQFQDLVRGIDATLRKRTRKPLFVPHLLIGSGGTFTSLAAMVMAQKGQALPVQGYQVTHAEVQHLLDRLQKMTPKARRGVPGLSVDRADIIVAGLAVIERIMRRFKVNRLQVHTGGVRDGLLLRMVEKSLGGVARNTHDRDSAVERFALNCGVDLPHCRHVARLAGEIFEQLIEPFALEAQDRLLLETAARLQDVGYLVNYEQHHKHSYHLILNSRLPGFDPQELEMIANVARYHRGAEPKTKHENYRQLSSSAQRRVRQLASILRIAGGLDRSHTQQVQSVRVHVQPDGVEIKAMAPALPEVDVWGARRRADFFESAFGTALEIEWEPAVSQEATLRNMHEPGGDGRGLKVEGGDGRGSRVEG